MRNTMFTLKAVDESDGSQSILVPFDHKWETALRDNHIGVVFRKRGPKAFTPDSIFVYIGAPSSLLIGQLKVQKFAFLPVSEALALSTSGGITEADLRKYAGEYKELAVFKVGAFEAASTPLALSKLASSYGFYPPQSFLRLSESGRLVLLEALGLAKASKKSKASSRG
jgi:predicted transcriptional regulator